MSEENKWLHGMVEINISLTKAVEIKYNINLEINISSLSCCEKNKAFYLPCEIKKMAIQNSTTHPLQISNGGHLISRGWRAAQAVAVVHVHQGAGFVCSPVSSVGRAWDS